MGFSKAAITVLLPREETQRRWAEHHGDDSPGRVTFKDAPGDRGTEIHLELDDSERGKVSQVVGKVTGQDPLAQAKDDLRRFKAIVETGEVPRSEGSPEGERAERKLKQRPAQPLDESELEKAGI